MGNTAAQVSRQGVARSGWRVMLRGPTPLAPSKGSLFVGLVPRGAPEAARHEMLGDVLRVCGLRPRVTRLERARIRAGKIPGGGPNALGSSA